MVCPLQFLFHRASVPRRALCPGLAWALLMVFRVYCVHPLLCGPGCLRPHLLCLGVVKASYLEAFIVSVHRKSGVWGSAVKVHVPHIQRHYHLMSEKERSLLGSPGYQLPAWGRGSIWSKHLAVGHLRTL